LKLGSTVRGRCSAYFFKRLVTVEILFVHVSSVCQGGMGFTEQWRRLSAFTNAFFFDSDCTVKYG